MYSRRLDRCLHLLSVTERVFTQLALFNPLVFEIHEQRMLFPTPCLHPLHGHPLAAGLNLSPIPGTLAIADQIGMPHAMVLVGEGEDARYAAYPYLGDLLLFLTDQNGQPFAVNWTIKLSAGDFTERRRNAVKTMAEQIKDKRKASLRNVLEEEYYRSAGIRTVMLSMEDIDPVVAANLDLVYGADDIEFDIDPSLLEDFSSAVMESAHAGAPPALVAIEYGKKWGRRDVFLAKIYADIWRRIIPVDFFQYIQIDQPLNIGGRDLLSHYGAFFLGTSS